ncbi:MAG: DUF1697 domain-containing protein [Gemmatimonadota bacterium]
MSATAIFLRGINLGRRRLTNEELKEPFVDAGFGEVQTFIASGNLVVGDATKRPGEGEEASSESALAALEARVEKVVQKSFGFQADAFARPLMQLAELVDAKLIGEGEAAGFTPHVIFLKAAPDAAAVQALGTLETEGDRFPVLDEQVIWLRRGGLSDSTVEQRHLEKALGGVPNTMRKVTTLRRMVAKFAG